MNNKFLLLSTESDELMIHRCQVFARQKNITVVMVPPKSSFSIGNINLLPEKETVHFTGTTFLTDFQKMNDLFIKILCIKDSFGKHLGCHSLYFIKPVISGVNSDMVGPLIVSEDSQGKISSAYLMLDQNFQLIDSENFLISL